MSLSRLKNPSVAFSVLMALSPFFATAKNAQDAAQPQHAALDQVLGTVTAVNTAEKTFSVKEDKTGTEFSVSAASARRFLKVPPGGEGFEKTQPIDASEIAVGDRLLARGHKEGTEPKLDASIVIVMTASDLEQKHAAELADWQKRGNRGVIASIDEASHQVMMNERTGQGAKTITVITTPETQFTRYSPAFQSSIQMRSPVPSPS